MAPIRMRNLVNLDIERNLVRSVQGGALHIIIGAEEVKNQEPLEHPLPPESAALIDAYIDEFRRHLTSQSGPRRWPQRPGGLRLRIRRAECCDCIEQATPVTDQGNAEILQVIGRQTRQHLLVDLVLAESLLVSLQPEPPQSAPNVHRVVPALVFGA